MICTRCRGLMFQEPVSARRRWIWLWACLACGDRIDETILLNRSMRRPETTFELRARILREIQLRVREELTA